MLVIAGAIVLGVLVGLLAGGSLRALGEIHFRWWPLAIVGLALQVVPTPTSGPWRWLGPTLLVASYVALLIFVALNVTRYRAFILVGVGFLLNVVVISVNGGMPVSDVALHRAYGSGYQPSVRELIGSGGAKHHLRRGDDELTWISDEIAVGTPVHAVYSPGDLIALVGLGAVMAQATRRPARAPVRRS